MFKPPFFQAFTKNTKLEINIRDIIIAAKLQIEGAFSGMSFRSMGYKGITLEGLARKQIKDKCLFEDADLSKENIARAEDFVLKAKAQMASFNSYESSKICLDELEMSESEDLITADYIVELAKMLDLYVIGSPAVNYTAVQRLAEAICQSPEESPRLDDSFLESVELLSKYNKILFEEVKKMTSSYLCQSSCDFPAKRHCDQDYSHNYCSHPVLLGEVAVGATVFLVDRLSDYS